MPSSYTESDRLHSSNQREGAAADQIFEYGIEFLDEEVQDPEWEEDYYEEQEDRYLDSAFEDRYYEPEPDFDYR